HSYRDFYAAHVEEAARRGMDIVPVEPRRRDSRIGEPVQSDVVEYVVAGEALRLSVEDTPDHFLAAGVVVHHPGGEADWRVHDPIERLRSIIHLDRITGP